MLSIPAQRMISIEEVSLGCGLHSIAKRVIAIEANKNYMPAQIFHVLIGSGSNERSENSEVSCGDSLE